MRPAVKKVILLGGGALAVLFMVGAPGLGQALDPAGEIADSECYSHHKEAGFRSIDLFPEVISEVPKGQAFTFRLAMRNPWLHQLQNVYAYVNISDAPGLSFPGGEVAPYEPAPIAGNFEQASPQEFAEDRIPVPVDVNATELSVTLAGEPGQQTHSRLGGLRNDFDLVVYAPNGTLMASSGLEEPPTDQPLPVTGNAPTVVETVRLDYGSLAGGMGEWSVAVRFRGAQPASYTLGVAVYYNLSKSTELRVPVTDLIPAPPDPASANLYTGEFTILAKDVESLQRMRYGAIAVAYHDHSDATDDDGNYNKWNTIEFPIGTTLVIGSAQVTELDVDTLSPIARRWAMVLGFAGSFLLVPSLVFGGTFGKGSVEYLNRVMGNPRRRVLFHNSMSFWLLGVSILHVLLLLYETQWGWSHGLVWGGLSLSCMIGLGVTGATQRSFVARWGFTRWRFVHFSMGVLVVVFTLIHMVADGSNLGPIREWLGAPKPT